MCRFVAITSSGPTLIAGTTESFTATATLANGTTQAVTNGVWGLDAPAIASVQASTGAVKGLLSGAVTVFVDTQDFHTIGLCASFAPGLQALAQFRLTQTGKTVSGVATLAWCTRRLFRRRSTATAV